jgi:hypothetical protein
MYGKSRLKALELFDVDSREGLAKLKAIAVRRGSGSRSSAPWRGPSST